MNNLLNALDINASCFAFASAGSGKTKLLVDRYIKSLVTGIKPADILCLTFTNFAVSEMFNRISLMLKNLCIQDDEYVKNYLINTLNIHKITDNLIQTVRNLFTNFQDNLQFTKITTIHSFCKDILSKFSIEADIPIGFNIIEQEDLNVLLQQAKQNYFKKLIKEEDNIPFSSYYLDELIDDIFTNNINYLSIYNNNLQNNLYNKLTMDNIQFTEQQQYIINKYFVNNNLEELFLTKTGSIRKNINCEYISKLLNTSYNKCHNTLNSTPIQNNFQNIINNSNTDFKEINNEILQSIADTVYKLRINDNKRNIIFKTKIFLKIIKGVYNELSILKVNNNVLDFNDIINKTYYLLKYSSYKDYILLEIAKNIKTILLDEAQDLSTIQWSILGFFIENCFTDILNNKSVFIVGDIKQSIYRFQNANYKAFIDFYNYSQKATKQFNKKLYTVYLDKSYRTLPNILKNIDNIFKNYSQFAFNNKYSEHIPARKGEGIFELVNTKNPKEIAQYIQSTNINNALVLFRSRNTFNTELYYELIQLGLNVAPLDKLYLKDIPITRSIIALANIAISNVNNNVQNTDNNLAFILQSNYVFEEPLNNQELFDICYDRQQPLLQIIKDKYIKQFNIIKNIIDLYKSNNLVEFFYYIIYKIIKIKHINDNDVLADFMDVVIKYSENYNENIMDFIKYFNNTEYTMHSYGNNNECIRFSSIHSAKGLEANNVILLNFKLNADKSQLKFFYKYNQNIFEPYNNNYLFFLKPSSNESCIEIENYLAEEYTEESKELFRLLYVALTRARDKLYIFNDGSGNNDNTIWNVIKNSLSN